MQRFGGIDSLIVNHGRLEPVRRIATTRVSEWRQTFETNLFSAVELVVPALPALRRARGSILLISSGAASHAYTAWGAYGASKAGLNHLAATLGAEEQGITTCAVRPGVLDTEMQSVVRATVDEMAESEAQKFVGAWKEGRLLSVDRVGVVLARMAVGLAGAAAAAAEAGSLTLSGRYLNWDDEALQAFNGPVS